MTSVTISNQQNPVFIEVTTAGSGASSWDDLADKPVAFPPETHNHPVSEVTGLQATLDSKANASHSHAIADTTGLQGALDAKAPTSHTHAISDTSGLQTALDGKAATSHTHSIANVTNLQTTLDGKASTSHSHAISDVTNLQSSLDGKAATSHTHTASQISDSTATGRSVLTAASAAAARTAIGAGTSSLALGTTSSTAKAGDYTPSVADLPAGSTLSVYWTGSAWPARPTARTDVTVQWIGGVEETPPSAGVAGKDIWIRSTV